MYKDNDHIDCGIIKHVFLGPDNLTQYKIKFKNNHTTTATSSQLTAPDETEISDIPTSPEDFIANAKFLDSTELALLAKPLPLNKLEVEWKRLHDKLGHLPFGELDKLVKHGILPSKFKSLAGKQILCPSCIFGRMRRRQWRFKGKKNLIRKDNQQYPGAKVSTDQIVVSQPGLVPRMNGRHTNDHVSGTTCFLDHQSGFSYSSLQTSLDGAQTLDAKLAFETLADSCGVEIKSYRADNGRFAEKSFRDSVKACNQTIGFCGVGAHHQNGIIEWQQQCLISHA